MSPIAVEGVKQRQYSIQPVEGATKSVGGFGGPLGDPLETRFCSRRLSVLLPLIVLPINPSLNKKAPKEVIKNEERSNFQGKALRAVP